MSGHTISDKHSAVIRPLEVSFGNDEELRIWIIDNSTEAPTYLLAHADDGVIWGRVDLLKDGDSVGNKTLTIGRDVVDESQRGSFAQLSLTTMQSLRMFSLTRELLLWRSETGWSGRMIEDREGDSGPTYVESLDEDQMLWGTRSELTKEHGFATLTHGQEGLRHVVPVACRVTDQKPLKLRVRHYLNQTGMARIIASRLVQFIME